ncbi:PH domain-containing protein [Rariglobus hedericola]|uniref:PH domain-containing protein n=1 Tax=Rariglobus hedericola TaxID=2597822 RepID=A0A556QGD9_9BACT|nr:PH domain-containing protein [Rariglobus hedericola]TSJ75710.1 PH domain-containing protein [Rariglobus hedericola]
MKIKEFTPSKKLKSIWIASGFIGSILLGLLGSGIALAAELNGAYGFLFGFLIPFILITGYISLYFPTIRYSVDDEYVTCASGVLWKVKRSIPLDKITNIDVRQGPIERLLGFGQIWIFTPSTGSNIPEEKLIGTEDPYAIKTLIIDISNNRSGDAKNGGSESITIDSPESSIAVLREILTTLKSIDRKMDQRQTRE